MTQGRRSWNAWDVPFFGTSVPKPVPDRPGLGPPVPFLALADGGARAAQRVMAVLLGIGSILGGAALTGLLLAASFILSFGSPPDRTEVLVASLLGAGLALGGTVLAVLTYLHAGRPSGVAVHEDQLEIAYRSFKRPMVVPRASVRAVAIDDGLVLPFQNNERFPVAGELPEVVFADALDNVSAGPWGDLDPDHTGWSSVGAAPGRPAVRRPAFLWSAHGSSLPFLRNGGLEAPNVAVLFDHPIRTPRPAWWFDLSPVISRCGQFRGGRDARGLLLNVRDASAAQEALTPWGVVRPITAADVAEEGLRVPKPLVGWRAAAYAAIVIGPAILNILFKVLR